VHLPLAISLNSKVLNIIFPTITLIEEVGAGIGISESKIELQRKPGLKEAIVKMKGLLKRLLF